MPGSTSGSPAAGRREPIRWFYMHGSGGGYIYMVIYIYYRMIGYGWGGEVSY